MKAIQTSLMLLPINTRFFFDFVSFHPLLDIPSFQLKVLSLFYFSNSVVNCWCRGLSLFFYCIKNIQLTLKWLAYSPFFFQSNWHCCIKDNECLTTIILLSIKVSLFTLICSVWELTWLEICSKSWCEIFQQSGPFLCCKLNPHSIHSCW